VAVLVTLRAEGLPRARSGDGVLADMRTGLQYALGTPEIRLTLGLLFLVSLFVFNFTVYVPLVVRTVLHLGAEGFGLLMACLGMGAVTGALTVGAMGARRPPAAVMFGTATLACSTLVLLSAVRVLWLAAALLFLTGLFGSCSWPAEYRHAASAPDELRGRVMSLYTLVWGGVFPIGAFLVGAVSEQWGVGTSLLVNGTAGLLGVVFLLSWWTSRDGSIARHREP